MNTFKEVISLWPSRSILADEIGVKAPAVRMWWSRNLIPGRKLRAVAEAAERAGFEGITYAGLCAMYRVARPASTST